MRTKLVAALALAAVASAPLSAQSGFKSEFVTNLKQVQDKYLQLANAIPQDKFTWRPAPRARSIAEVYLHIANAQYLFGGPLKIVVPAGHDPKTFESSTTDKAQVIAAMTAAFAAMNAAVMALPENSAENQVKLFGQNFTTRALLLVETDHNAEHLGQSIAYANMVGVVPPWNAPKAGGM